MLTKPKAKVVKGAELSSNSIRFKKVFDLLSSINGSLGYKRFTRLFINRVYYVVGCGILIEYQDSEKTISVVTNIENRVLSCKLFLRGFEYLNILNNYKCNVTPNCLILE